MGLRPGAGRGDSVAALGSPVCAVGPGGCQAGKQERASPAPRSGTGRKGKGRGQEGQSGARGGVGGTGQAGRAPGSPRARCALQPPCPWAGARGRQRGRPAPLNLAQDKQPCAAGEHRRAGKRPSRFPLAPLQRGGAAALTRSARLRGGTVPRLLPARGLLPFRWCCAEQPALAVPPGFLLPSGAVGQKLLPQVLPLSRGWWGSARSMEGARAGSGWMFSPSFPHTRDAVTSQTTRGRTSKSNPQEPSSPSPNSIIGAKPRAFPSLQDVSAPRSPCRFALRSGAELSAGTGAGWPQTPRPAKDASPREEQLSINI